MKKAQVTLHCLPEELLSWVSRLLSGTLVAACISPWPEFSVALARTGGEFRGIVARDGVPFRVCLARSELLTGGPSLLAFMRDNDDAIECIVDIGSMNGEGLRQSSVSVFAKNEAEMRVWSSPLKELRLATKTGMWVVNPMSGARQLSKNSRYSEGAASAAKEGTRLLPIGGWTYYEIGDTSGS
jgi:hypothetical protein